MLIHCNNKQKVDIEVKKLKNRLKYFVIGVTQKQRKKILTDQGLQCTYLRYVPGYVLQYGGGGCTWYLCLFLSYSILQCIFFPDIFVVVYSISVSCVLVI
jgi:hypothetical protein